MKQFNMMKKIDTILNLRANPMWREMFRITWPALIELVMMTLFGMVDMIMVGRLGPAAITSVGLTNQPFMLLMAIFAAVNIGGTTLVAWNVGGNNLNKAKDVTRQIIILNLILGAAMSILGVLAAGLVVRFMGAGPDTVDMAKSYFQIVASGLIFQAVIMGVTACLRGAGQTRIPMAYNVGSNLLNVFGNYVLIYGKWGFPCWGVAGAAVSTTLSRLIACLAALYVVYLSRRSELKISFKDNHRINWDIIKKIFAIGLPSALEQFVLQSGLMLFAKIVSGLGTAGFAAHQIGLNISGLSFAPSMAFGVGATTLVGQSLGAGDTLKAEQYARFIRKIAVGTAMVMGLIFILFSHPLARLYTSDLVVAGMAGTVLKILALAQPGQSTQLTLAGALRGAGDTMYPLYASILGIWFFRVGATYLFVEGFGWGLIGAWIALVMDQYIRSFVIYLRFRSGKWKYIKARVSRVPVQAAGIGPNEKQIIAYHEIGHALVAAKQSESAPVHKITIIPWTSDALGYTMQIKEGERVLMSKEEAFNQIATYTGGRAAEELVFNTVTSSALNDIEQATKIARSMVTRLGMSDSFGMIALGTVDQIYLGGDASLAGSPETSVEIDQEVLEIIKKANQKAIDILNDNLEKLHDLAQYLLEKETITGKEFMEILKR